MDTSPIHDDKRLGEVADLILQFSIGNFNARVELTDTDDHLNIIMAGLNMLGDELMGYRQKIKRDERRFRAMIEHSKDAIVIISENGEILYLSPNNETILGYTDQEIIKNTIYKDKERFKKIFEHYIGTHGKMIRTQWKRRHKNGHWIWLEVVASNLMHEPAINGIIINYRDITKSKKALLQKEFDDNNLKSLINNTEDLMWSVDRNFKLITSNKAFDEILRLLTGITIKKGQNALIGASSEEQLKRWTTFYERALSGAIFTETEHSSSPVEQWSEISFYPILQQNIIVGVACYSRNITELKRAQILKTINRELTIAKELAENSKKAKEQFLANMSHEIRTPMNAIMGMVEILGENNLNPEQKECVDAIKLSSDNLLSIINDILDFSKIESGKITFEKRPFVLGKLIEEIIQTLQFTANPKSISLTYSIAENIPSFIIGDDAKLRQILLNLCGNSIKFTEKGYVSIDIQLKEQQNDDYILLFKVTDTGIGIPEDKLQTIFESFAQASGDTTRKYGGTGLGLTITKQLVELQGGSVFVKSKENEGSQFSFTLTFEKENELPKRNENEETYVYTRLEGKKVLLVEDNSMNQLLAKKILNSWNLKYDVAANGKIAIEKLANEDYDIILMDMHMPEMDGYEATKYIRTEMPPPKSLIPIIAVTANAILGEEEKCRAAGMNDYISKPLDKRKLYQKMIRLLR